MTDTKKHLTYLEAVGLIRLVKTHPELEFMFRHALIRDAAYKSLLREDRKKLHRQVAEAIEQTYPDQLDEHAASLAHHYTEAGLKKQAIPYWQQAGDYAKQRSANTEAIEQFSNGLKLLKTLPDTPECTSQELALQIGLGSVLMANKGYAAPEVEKAYTRARELCGQLGETPQLFPVLYGLYVFHLDRAQYQTARDLAEQMLRLAQGQPDSVPLLRANVGLGTVLLLTGETALAREYFEQGMALYTPHQYHTSAFLYGIDPIVVGLSYLAEVLWLLGYPDQALERSREALTLAQEISHPNSLAHALTHALYLYHWRRERPTIQEQAIAAITLSTEQNLPFYLTVGILFQGWLLAEEGRFEEGLVEIRRGLANLLAIGMEIVQPYYLALLAEALRKARQVEEGLITVAQALAIVEKTGEHMGEAELYRLKGELLLKAEGGRMRDELNDSTPESCFLKAIEVARSQQAKSLELRATVSLSRLWQSQGRRAEARQLLTEIYGWFTEGFDTLDLQEAKALLEELG